MTDMQQNALTAGIFATIAAMVSADLLADSLSGIAPLHLSIELAATAIALGGGAFFARRALATRAEARAWRARAEELLAGVGKQVEAQFASWGLTEAEAEVGVLLLKGLSMKEIASVRDTSERTARDQARAVYRKAGVAGRAELSAWFLEDLLPGADPVAD